MPVPLPPALDLLRCPACCTCRLHPGHGVLCCPVGHTFDIARHGYASLLTRATSADDAAMVQARARFLPTGTYAPVREVGARLAADAMSSSGPSVACRISRPAGRIRRTTKREYMRLRPERPVSGRDRGATGLAVRPSGSPR